MPNDPVSTEHRPVTIYLDSAGKANKIEAPSPAAASEAYRGISAKEAFNDDDIEEISRLIDDTSLKSIIERDLQEINACFNAGANKSILLLCGGIIEIFLYQFLSRSPEDAKGYFNDLKRDAEPEKLDQAMDRWVLGDMLKVAEHFKMIDPDFYREARKITNYRNIIHPTYEVRESVDQIEHLAPISIQLIKEDSYLHAFPIYFPEYCQFHFYVTPNAL
jgi:hypothetical protein